MARGQYDGGSQQVSLTTWGYDPASRLASITHDLQNLGGGTSYDITTTFGYNAAGQMTTKTPNNALYASPFFAVADRTFGVNALNQITTNTPAGGTAQSLTYAASGSLATDGAGMGLTYTPERRLSNVWIDGVSKASLGYDPAGRLEVVVDQNAFASFFGYDGERLTTEYAAGGAVMRRFIYGPGVDEPLVWSTTKRGKSLGMPGYIVCRALGGGVVMCTVGPGECG